MKKNHSHNNMIIFSDDDEKILDELINSTGARRKSNFDMGLNKDFESLSMSAQEYSSSGSNGYLSNGNSSSPMSFSMSSGSSAINSSMNSSKGTNTGKLMDMKASNNPIIKSDSNIVLGPLPTSKTTTTTTTTSKSGLLQQQQQISYSSNSLKVKNSHWFEDEQNDFHHFDVSFNPHGNRVFYAGEKVEVHLKVNVKKLQCLVATFECISTSNNNKLHSLDKNRIHSQDIHLYPTDKDLPPRQRSNSQRNSLSLSPIISDDQLTTSTNNINNSTSVSNSPNILKKETQIINQNHNINNKNVLMRKSISAGDYSTSYHTTTMFDDEDECTFLEPLPESAEEDKYQPPIVHSCSEHQVITNRKHKFIFRFTIPANSPPSIVLNKDSKSGVFYRLFISGLGELHSSKFNTDKAMIKGIQTSVPLMVQTLNLSYLPKELLTIPIESFTCSINPITNIIQSNSNSSNKINGNIHLKSRLICKNYGIVGSNILIHISIYNQSNITVKGFKIDLINIQKSIQHVITNDDSQNTSTIDNPNNNINNNNTNTSNQNSQSKEKKKISKKEKSSNKLNEFSNNNNNTIQVDPHEEDINSKRISNNNISSIKFKLNDRLIQSKGKYVDTVSFSIPSQTIPSIYLNNLLNIYVLRISLRKYKNCFVEVPLLLLPN